MNHTRGSHKKFALVNAASRVKCFSKSRLFIARAIANSLKQLLVRFTSGRHMLPALTG